ncbi:MAG: hypothetical protein V4490_00320, partial [Pseudomonadota bacterium]
MSYDKNSKMATSENRPLYFTVEALSVYELPVAPALTHFASALHDLWSDTLQKGDFLTDALKNRIKSLPQSDQITEISETEKLVVHVRDEVNQNSDPKKSLCITYLGKDSDGKAFEANFGFLYS